MKNILKRVCTGFLALATVITTLPATTAHAAEKQYWTESAERVGIIEQVMNDGSIKATFNYVEEKVMEPVQREYQFAEVLNPVFTKDGDNIKVNVSVKYLDNLTKAEQISQYELILHKDSNWKIVG